MSNHLPLPGDGFPFGCVLSYYDPFHIDDPHPVWTVGDFQPDQLNLNYEYTMWIDAYGSDTDDTVSLVSSFMMRNWWDPDTAQQMGTHDALRIVDSADDPIRAKAGASYYWDCFGFDYVNNDVWCDPA